MAQYAFNPITGTLDRVGDGGGGGGSITIVTDNGAITGSTIGIRGGNAHDDIPIINTEVSGPNVFVYNNAWATPYVVDALTTPGERGTFSNIQAAIYQATQDGAGTDNQKIILIRNGAYAENLVIPSGIFLKGDDQILGTDGIPNYCTVAGNHTVIGPCVFRAENIKFLNVSPDDDMFDDGADQIWFCDNCDFDNGGSSGVICTVNFPAGTFKNCYFRGNPGSVNIDLVGADVDFTNCKFMDSGIISATEGTIAKFHHSQVRPLVACNASQVIAEDTLFIGGENAVTGAGGACSYNRCVFNTTGFGVTHAGRQTFTACSMADGTFSGLYPFDSNYETTSSQMGNVASSVRVEGNITVNTNQYLLEVDTSAGPITVTLPAEFPADRCWIVKDVSGTAETNPITIQVDGTGNIDGLPLSIINTNYGAVCYKGSTDGENYLVVWEAYAGGGGGGGITTLLTNYTTAEFSTVGSTSILDFSGQNLLIGSDGDNITLSLANTGFGVDALENLSVGDGNTAVGQQALNANQGGSRNTAIGLNSLQEFNPGATPALTNNTAVGANTLQNLSDGVANTAVGYSAGSNYTADESSNILVGSPGVSGESNTTRIGSQGSGEGQQDRAFIAGVAGSTVAESRIVGVSPDGQLSEFGTGTSGQVLVSGGAGVSPTWQNQSGGGGVSTLLTNATTADFSTAGSTSTLDFSGDNLLVGSDGSLTDGLYNTGYGISALEGTTTGVENSALGVSALQSNSGGSRNTAVGSSALSAFNSGNTEIYTYNSAVGSNSLISLVDGVWNTALGSLSGIAYTGSESSNILVQNQGVAGESNTIRIGTSGSGIGNQNRAFIAGVSGVTVSDSRIVGISPTGQLSEFGDGEEGQVLVSGGAGVSPTWQDQEGSGLQTLTGNDGLPVSPAAGNIDVIAANSSVIFRRPGAGVLEIDFGEQNFCLGSPLLDLTTGTQNTGVGSGALYTITTGSSNTALGIGSGHNIVSGSNNTFVGVGAGNLTNVSSGNTCVGVSSMHNASGPDCYSNTAVGHNSLGNIPSGLLNTAIGHSAGASYTTDESNNVVIGSPGVAGDDNTVRIGADTHTRFFGAGISGVSVSNSSIVGVNAAGQLSDLGKGTAGQVLMSLGASSSPTWGNAAKGIVFWQAVNSPTSSQAITPNVGYINKSTAATVTFTLPTGGGTVGDRVMITNMTNSIIRIAQNASQNISFLNQTTTTGVTGYVQSFDTPAKGFCLELLCVTANTEWLITNLTGNATLA